MPKAKAKSQVIQQGEVEKERSEFHTLTAINPNYFGNLASTWYEAVIDWWKPNVKYEELTCLGYNPKMKMLEATIQVKLWYGYGSGLCGDGSTEYVRFFIDYGSGWQDCGLSAVNVHNLPTTKDCANKKTKPLTYVVTLPLEPEQDWCNHPVLPKVRAILSWNKIPGPDPEDKPVWGNVLDRYIQIEPREPIYLDIFDKIGKISEIVSKFKLPQVLEEAKFDPIPLPDPPPLKVSQLAAKYKSHRSKKLVVPAHRFGTKDLEAATSPHTLVQEAQLAKMEEWKAAGLSWKEAVEAYTKTKGDVSYEELICLGLDTSRDWLVATFVVKKPYGYCGDLCDEGSREYVSFWADWDNTCQWTYLDTTWIDVHDISPLPGGGLFYTVVLPVDLSAHRQPCEDGAKIGRIRAVLSWNTMPSPDPDKLPKWGNRLDTHVQIKPEGALTGNLAAIGGVGVKNIHTFSNGKTKSGAKFAFFDMVCDPHEPSRECPFGGRVQFHGVPAANSKYKIIVRKVSSSTFTVLDTPIWITNSVGDSSYHYPDASGYFDTLPQTANIGSLLAVWDSHKEKLADKNALWEARMVIILSGGGIALTPWYKIRLDNTAPKAEIHIDSGGDCKDFEKGVTINGHFVARDLHFGYYTLRTLPTSQGPPNPTPHYGTLQTAVAPGDVWNLVTSGMNPCGYVVELRVWDRTIVGSRPNVHNYARDDSGFCLRKKT